MLLPGTEAGEKLCAVAEELLTEISGAFHHSLSLMREKIGEKSIAAYGEPLTEETVDACMKCQAVFLGDGACKGADELFDSLEMPVRIRSYCVPDSLCGRHESPVNLWLAKALSLDAETTSEAFQRTFEFAREENAPLHMILPTGSASKALWEEQIKGCQASFLSVCTHVFGADEAVARLITAPEALGLVLCPPYAGSILLAAADALCPHPGLIYDCACTENIALYASHIAVDDPDEKILNPISVAHAVAHLLRVSLHLRQEADCLDAAVNNVLFTGWRGDEIDAFREEPDQLVERICEQIAVAGELVAKGGFPK